MEKEKGGHKEIQRRYEEKGQPYTKLENDPGALGKNRSDYEEKKAAAGHGLHSPRGGMAENRAKYAKKERQGGKD